MPRHPARPFRSTLFLCAALTLGAGRLKAQAGLMVPTSTGRPDAAVLSLR